MTQARGCRKTGRGSDGVGQGACYVCLYGWSCVSTLGTVWAVQVVCRRSVFVWFACGVGASFWSEACEAQFVFHVLDPHPLLARECIRARVLRIPKQHTCGWCFGPDSTVWWLELSRGLASSTGHCQSGRSAW